MSPGSRGGESHIQARDAEWEKGAAPKGHSLLVRKREKGSWAGNTSSAHCKQPPTSTSAVFGGLIFKSEQINND